MQKITNFQWVIQLIATTLFLAPVYSYSDSPVPDAQRIEAVRRFVEKNQTCRVSEDCLAVELGCPFGCEAVIINRTSKTALMLEAENIVGKCRYDCGDSYARAACKQGRCVRYFEDLFSSKTENQAVLHNRESVQQGDNN